MSLNSLIVCECYVVVYLLDHPFVVSVRVTEWLSPPPPQHSADQAVLARVRSRRACKLDSGLQFGRKMSTS